MRSWPPAVRAIERERGRSLAVIADLQGPKLRIGDLPAPVVLSRGDEVVAGPEGDQVDLPIAPEVVGGVLEAGNDILIDDGHVRLRVERVDNGRAVCSVVVGGTVESHKGVNLPGVAVPIPSLTEKDRGDLAFALDLGADFIALSFVRSPDDVRELRKLIDDAGSEARVIAKIEKAEAVHALGPIVDAADAVMVARGDLGVEIGPAAVPLLQKRMILLALERGRPVITATQMLESMLHAPEPTRAEASDVANAVLDGTSALMLSEETAVGEYPVEAVSTMDVIARTVEPSQGHRHELPAAGDEPTVGEAISNAACDIAESLHAVALVVPTFTGGAASAVARLRPRRPDRRDHPRRARGAAAGARVGRGVAPHRRLRQRRAAVEPVDRSRARGRAHRVRRPGRDHGRHAPEHAGVDERHQGRRRAVVKEGRDRGRTGPHGRSPRPTTDHAKRPARLARGGGRPRARQLSLLPAGEGLRSRAGRSSGTRGRGTPPLRRADEAAPPAEARRHAGHARARGTEARARPAR